MLRHLNSALPPPWPRLATRSHGDPSTRGVRVLGWSHGLGLSWPQPDTSSPPLSIVLPLGSYSLPLHPLRQPLAQPENNFLCFPWFRGSSQAKLLISMAPPGFPGLAWTHWPFRRLTLLHRAPEARDLISAIGANA